jgi:hypothetical protein
MIIQSGITIGSNITIGDLPTVPYIPTYTFSTFTFQTGNIVGPTGPTAAQLFGNTYSNVGNTWLQNSSLFSVINGYQYWTVPQDGNYQIVAAGSRSGIGTWSSNVQTPNMYGRGATISGTFALTQGQVLAIAVGQPSANVTQSNYIGVGGGGGTFVVLGNTFPLVVAGAGGGNGAYSSVSNFAGNAQTTANGGASWGGAPGGANGLGGNSHVNGSGTASLNTYDGGGGGGFSGNGASGTNNASRPGSISTTAGQGGLGFAYGLTGGSIATNFATNATYGGFGGGGGGTPIAGGGGGGYSGGGGGYATSGTVSESGGGGGSWVAANATAIATHTGTFNGSSTFNGLTVTTVGTPNSGPGYVTITKV